MISILEAILFVYHMYRNRRQSSGGGNDQASRRSFVDGCRYIIQFLSRNFEPPKTNEEAENVLSQLQSIRDEIRQEISQAVAKTVMEARSAITLELKREIGKVLTDRIGATREYNGVWITKM